MEDLSNIGRWISANESLLSGLVALVILIGLVASPIGKGLRHLYLRRRQSGDISAGALTPVNTATMSEPLLAVLAFDNLSNDPETQFFSDGVSEEIIQRLARYAGDRGRSLRARRPVAPRVFGAPRPRR